MPFTHCRFGFSIALFGIARENLSLQLSDGLVLDMMLAQSSTTSRPSGWSIAWCTEFDISMASGHSDFVTRRDLALLSLDSVELLRFETEATGWSAQARAVIVNLRELWVFPCSLFGSLSWHWSHSLNNHGWLHHWLHHHF